MTFPACLAILLRVVVLDTGLNLDDPRFQNVLCPDGHMDFTNTTINDLHGHGTHIAGLIRDYAGKESLGNYCMVIYKYYAENNDNDFSFTQAIQNTGIADIVNISGGGKEFVREEYVEIKNNIGTMYIAAAGNEDSSVDKYFPAGYDLPNIIKVGALNRMGGKLRMSNYGNIHMVWELGENVESDVPGGRMKMSGTSQATAIFTGKYIKKLLEIK